MLNTERIKTVARALIGGCIFMHSSYARLTNWTGRKLWYSFYISYQKSTTKWNTQSIHNDLLFLLLNRQGANIFLKITASMWLSYNLPTSRLIKQLFFNVFVTYLLKLGISIRSAKTYQKLSQLGSSAVGFFYKF